MNKTININLGGVFYHIDEDAYDKLQHYLVLLKKSFHDTQGNDEIISDIELRIAELFSERIHNSKQVINTKDVEFVIETMGKPEEISDEENSYSEKTENNKKEEFKEENVKKQLFRDSENKTIGGVLSGLAHYIGIEAVWARIIWVLLCIFTSGGFVLIYFILWMFMPEAITTNDKLKMRGKKINVSNIEKTIKDELNHLNKGMENLGDKIKSADYKSFGNKIKEKSDSAIKNGGSIIGRLLRVVLIIIGIIIMIKASIVILGLTFTWLFGSIIGAVDFFVLEDFNMYNYTSLPLWAFITLAFILLVIPFIFMLFIGIKLTFLNSKKKFMPAVLTLSALWFFCLIIGGYFAVKQTLAFKQENSVTSTIKYNIPKSETLKIIALDETSMEDRMENRMFDFNIYETPDGQTKIVNKDVDLYVKHTDQSTPYIKIKKSASDANSQDAFNNAKQIEYKYLKDTNTLALSPYLLYNIENKFHGQEVDFYLYLPNGYSIKVQDKLNYKLGLRFEYNYDLYDRSMLTGNTWKMVNNKLECTTCSLNNIDNNDSINLEDYPQNTDSKKVYINKKFSQKIKQKIGKTSDKIKDSDYDF